MHRLRNAKTGVIVNVDHDTAVQLTTDGWVDASSPTAGGYASMKVADLKAEIERRNEGREEPDRLPGDGKKADLVAALEADDAPRDEQ
jgi:hypothetical protein